MPGNNGMFPALNLFPLNDSFVPKHIVLAGGQRVKIGRQTNAKTVPGERNGYFDSKVLSRQHAEVWEEGGKIFIKDVKSSNGTFINGARLSQEGVESPPFELNTDDIVEFGIDIVGEDNQTIIHHKVAAKVQCLLTQEDVNAAQQQAAYAQQAQQHGLAHSQQGHLQQAPPGQRRPSIHGAQNHQASLGALAPMGRAPNKNGLSFDHILTKLQNEVQRSRETSAELHSLTSAMSDIHDSLGGVSAQPVPAYPHVLPPVRQDSDPGPQQMPPPQETAAISTLQEQLHHTQSLLSTHVEKIHSLGLESIVGEHDGLKREIGLLRDMLDQRKHDMELETSSQHRKQAADEDEDDAQSVSTIIGSNQYQDEEVEEENDEERRRRREELGRPRTPEPSMGLDGDSDGEGDIGVRGIAMHSHRGTIRGSWEEMPETSQTTPEQQPASRETVERLTERLEQLTAQFESSLELSRDLQAKQQAAQEQIASLQAKVEELEALKEAAQAVPQPPPSDTSASTESTSSVLANIMDLTKNLEGRWERQQEEWGEERERLRAAKEEWERRVRRVEEDLTGVREIAASASTSAVHANTVATANAKEIAALSAEFHDEAPLNREGDSEFAPPSPRSIASDVLRKRKRSIRPRSRSSSRSPTRSSPNGHAINEDDAGQPYSPASLNSAPYATNGSAPGSQGYNDGRRLPATVKDLDHPTRSDSTSSSSVISSVSGRKPDIPIPYMSAVATLGVALVGVAAWTAANHIHA